MSETNGEILSYPYDNDEADEYITEQLYSTVTDMENIINPKRWHVEDSKDKIEHIDVNSLFADSNYVIRYMKVLNDYIGQFNKCDSTVDKMFVLNTVYKFRYGMNWICKISLFDEILYMVLYI